MLNNLKGLYIENLAYDFRTNFENKTGKEIGTGKYFDVTEVINFYGGIIELQTIYDEEYKLDAYICKIEDDDYDFKIIIDKDMSEKLKSKDKDGNICYGNWNLYIMNLFYRVISANKKMEEMKNGDIIYPEPEYVKNVLQNISEKSPKKLIKEKK